MNGIADLATGQQHALAFSGVRIIPTSQPEIENGALVVQNGTIQCVGPRQSPNMPDNSRVIDMTGTVIMPGLICAHGHIGGWGGGDRSGPIQPETRILDAINVKSSGFKWAQDIANALRLILDGAAEAYLMIEYIREAGISVIIHSTMMRAFEETENASFGTAFKLIKAGIPVALQSGYEAYVPKTQVVLFQAGYTAAHGLSFEKTLGAITIEAAEY